MANCGKFQKQYFCVLHVAENSAFYYNAMRLPTLGLNALFGIYGDC